MTRVIIETTDQWVADRIGVMLQNEANLLRKTVQNIKLKIRTYEEKYGFSETMSLLYGKVDDMELIEWEGELETLTRLEKKLVALEGVHVETE